MDDPTIDDPGFWEWFFNNHPPEFPIPVGNAEPLIFEELPGDNSVKGINPGSIEQIDF